MATADSGSWKLLIYPIMIIFIIGLVLNLTVKPFVDDGQNVDYLNSTLRNKLVDIVNTGNVFNITEIDLWVVTIPVPNQFDVLGDTGKTVIIDQINIFTYIPTWLQIPLILIITVCFVYAIWVLISMLIP